MTAIADLPDIRPSLLLDFANSGRVDPRIECTRASAATCFGPDGKLRTVAANVPRIDYDPATGKCLGLLVEEARTNYLKYSADFSQNVWAKIRSSIALNSAGVKAPDGSIAYKLVEDSSTSNTHNINQPLRLEPNTEYTFSAFIKAAERQYAVMSVGNFVTQENPQALRINLVTGSVLGGAEGRYKITKLQDGWFIVSSMFKTAATISVDSLPNIFTAIDQTPTGNTYSGDGVSGIYVGGVQLEVGAFPTSYIPTEASAVTRGQDYITMALGKDYANVGGVFIRGEIPVLNNNASPKLLRLQNTSVDAYYEIIDTVSGKSAAGYSSTAYTFSSSISNGRPTRFKVGLSWRDSNVVFGVDGQSISKAQTQPPVGPLNQLRLFTAINSANRMSCGWVGSVSLYNDYISAAQVERLTA